MSAFSSVSFRQQRGGAGVFADHLHFGPGLVVQRDAVLQDAVPGDQGLFSVGEDALLAFRLRGIAELLQISGERRFDIFLSPNMP